VDQATGSCKGAASHGFYNGVADQLVRYAKGWVKYNYVSPRYKTRDGKGNESLSAQMKRTGRADRIKPYDPEPELTYLVDAFWECKAGHAMEDINFSIAPHLLLDARERAILRKADIAFKHALENEQAKDTEHTMSKGKK